MEISSLPHDVLLDILMRLPVKPLIRFSLSSKQYLSLIHHPHFINRHSTHSKIYPSRDDNFLLLCCYTSEICSKYYSLCSFTDGGKTLIEHKRFRNPFKFGRSLGEKIVGSSNGLVCLSDSNLFPQPGDTIIIWNVVIGKYKKLSLPYLSTHPHRDSFSHGSIGFGFVLETNDFKVVQIMCYDQVPVVLVYSMELNTWRKIEANIALCSNDTFRNSNVYVNGAVHWLVNSYKKVGFPHSIMSFDMKGEIFKEIGMPNNRRNRKYWFRFEMSASACDETLSLFIRSKDSKQWEVWLMKEYGVVDSWTRQFCIADRWISKPLKVMDNGDVLLGARSRNHRKLVLCDAESQQIKNLVFCDAKYRMMIGLGIDPMRLDTGIDAMNSVVTFSPSLSLLDRGEKYCAK